MIVYFGLYPRCVSTNFFLKYCLEILGNIFALGLPPTPRSFNADTEPLVMTEIRSLICCSVSPSNGMVLNSSAGLKCFFAARL